MVWAPTTGLTAEPATPLLGPLRPGESRVLATYYEIRKSDCLALSAPQVRLLHQPTLGSITLVQSQGLADQPSQCAHVAVPVTQVLYQARELGADDMAWEVQFQTGGREAEQGQAQLVIVPHRPTP
jgi:hypothetical protein